MKIKPRNIALTAAVVVASEIAVVPIASALQVEEVIVTARKRSESLQEVPLAVAALSGDLMTDLGVESAGDIALFTPNFTWNTEFGRASPQPYLRGIGTNNFNPINTGPIAVYQDGIYIGPNIAQGFSTFDLERVEVLKGPQGTLYGRNSTGGLVNFISRKPEIGAGSNGFARLELGQFGTTNFEGAFGFDLSDTSAARIAVTRNLNKGTFRNINPDVDSDDVSSVDDWAIRAQLLLEPSSDLSILANVHVSEASPDTAPFKSIGLFNPGTGDPCDETPRLGANCSALNSFPDDGDIYTTSKNEDFENVDASGIFVKIDYQLSDTLSLVSSTSYDTAELERLDDSDDVSTELELDHYADDFDFYSQELRLSSTSDDVSWHAGMYYYNESNEGILAFTNPIFGSGVGNAHKIDTLSYAIFGQIDWNVTNKISVGAGLRWTYEEKDVKQYDAFAAAYSVDQGIITSLNGLDIFDGTFASGTTGAEDFDEITGRLSIDYTTDNGNLVYASLSRGFKGGDVLGSGVVPVFGPTPYTDDQVEVLRARTEVVAPEILDALEVGVKSSLLGGKMRLNGAVFYYIYKDQQQTVLQEDPTGQADIGISTLNNAGRSEIPGAEVEIIYTPTSSWYLQLNAGILDPTYEEFNNPVDGGADFSGNQIPLTPRRELSALARYDFEVNDGAILAVQVDTSYKSSTFFQAQNDDTFIGSLLQEDSFTLWNARISYATGDGKWVGALFARNLTEEEYFGSGFEIAPLGIVAIKPGPRRYFGASLEYNFGN